MAESEELKNQPGEGKITTDKPNGPEPEGKPTTPAPEGTQRSSIDESTATKLKEYISRDVSKTVSETVSTSIIERIGRALGLTKEEEQQLPKTPDELQKMIDDFMIILVRNDVLGQLNLPKTLLSPN